MDALLDKAFHLMNEEKHAPKEIEKQLVKMRSKRAGVNLKNKLMGFFVPKKNK